jgi:hypothetical protein
MSWSGRGTLVRASGEDAIDARHADPKRVAMSWRVTPSAARRSTSAASARVPTDHVGGKLIDQPPADFNPRPSTTPGHAGLGHLDALTHLHWLAYETGARLPSLPLFGVCWA